MSQIISFRRYHEPSHAQLLVLVDLQLDTLFSLDSHCAGGMVANCRAALGHARQFRLPVAFARSIAEADAASATGLRWIDGFLPARSDVVFDRYRPSCYANTAFADVVSAHGGQFALAGFSGEAACLATALDAFHRGHRMTFLSDASASRKLDEFDAVQTHGFIAKLISLYAAVLTTAQWIDRSTLSLSASARR